MTDQPLPAPTPHEPSDADQPASDSRRAPEAAPRAARLRPRAVAPAASGEADRRPGLPHRDGPAGDPAPGTDQRVALDLARRVVDLAADKKAADIVLLAVGELTTLADYFVICSGGSERQLAAIADGIAEGLRDEGVKPIGREGVPGAHWLLMDFGAVVVHIFAPPERDFYQLEKRWADAPMLLRVQ